MQCELVLEVEYLVQQHELLIGGTTPGGTDYYVKDGGNGNAYVVAGSIVRDLMNADQRLVEHKMHGFEDAAPKRVKITAGGATREIVDERQTVPPRHR